MVGKEFHRGDIVYVDLSPTSGHEQTGKRPVLVMRNEDTAKVTNMTVVCPITSTDRKHPLHCRLDERTKTTGVILCEQVRSLDLSSRDAELREKAPSDIVEECADIIKAMIE